MRLSEKEEAVSEALWFLMIHISFAFSVNGDEKKPPHRLPVRGPRWRLLTLHLGGPHPASTRPRMPMGMRTMDDRTSATTMVADRDRSNKASCMADSTLPPEEARVKPCLRRVNSGDVIWTAGGGSLEAESPAMIRRPQPSRSPGNQEPRRSSPTPPPCASSSPPKRGC